MWLEITRHVILIRLILVTGTKRNNRRKRYQQLLPVRPKTVRGKKNRKKRKATATFFALHANAITNEQKLE